MSNEIELFTKLLKAANVVSDSELTEAVNCAKHLEIPLERALTMLKVVSDESIAPAIKAKEMVCAGKISLEEAGNVLKHANQHGISFEDALPKKDSNDPSLRISGARINHPLAEFFLAPKLVTHDQLNQALHKSQSMDLPLGKTLIISRFITRWTLGEVLNAAYLVKDDKIPREQAVNLLRDAIQHRISVIQVLFESGNFSNRSGDTITLSELLLLGGCLGEADFQDIEERRLTAKKTCHQIIADYKIVESSLLQAADSLLEMVGDYLKPFQAAQALKQVKTNKIPVYQAIAELKPPPQLPPPQLRLGDLLVESGIVSRQSVEKIAASQQPTSTLVRIGKQLLDAQLIDDTNLYNALRCQSLFREGIISAQQTVAALSCAHDEKIKLDEAFSLCGIYAPIRMQWNWQ